MVVSVDDLAELCDALAVDACPGGGSADDCGAGGVEVEAEAGGGAADMVWKYVGVAEDFMFGWV